MVDTTLVEGALKFRDGKKVSLSKSLLFKLFYLSIYLIT